VAIIGIEAPQSAGKTLVMTYFLWREYVELQKPLLTNYALLQLPHNRITHQAITYYVQNKIALRRIAIGIDEAHLWLDSRMSMSVRNRVLSYFITQTSKNDINLYYTTQDLGMVDRRLRAQTQIGITVEQTGEHDFRVYGVNKHSGKTVIDAVLDGRLMYDHFDTHEVVSLPDDETPAPRGANEWVSPL
jgi:hypothetical protein